MKTSSLFDQVIESSSLDRRKFLKLLGLAGATLAVPRLASAATPLARVVVVGGGFGGATAAKYLALWGKGKVQVTLVDANPQHISCILSNLVVTGSLSMADITIGLGTLASKYGIKLVVGRATEVNPSAKTVAVSSTGGTVPLPYDHLILAPGIDFVMPAGSYDANLTPHAWVAGTQTTLLKGQVAGLKKGGVFLMNIPKAPYRCPPGPYERACVIADHIKRKKLGGKVIVCDANPGITAEPVGFGNAFANTFKGIVDYKPNCTVLSVSSASKTFVTSLGNISGQVANFLPDMKAGALVSAAGLVDAGSRWAAVDPLSYGSIRYPEIHVIGDSQATAQPKSGTMANAQAKVCADAILRAIDGQAPNPAPVTMSACYSPITSKTASWLTASYQYDTATRAMKRVDASFGEAKAPSAENYIDMFDWANSLFEDTFL
jgi:NADPH-dependent 2,4-dienoyl-CoA reductase/sulfur reductase-like enzyme